uniref:Chromodomain helicase DNA binding protein 7 n=1 Tax=Seriola lalandi dorsalis TaxID=1841481 RepID=A0A3B4YMB6_SERLL
MADPGMLSLFGDDAGLFSDGLDGLGGCFPQQPAPGQSNPLAQQTNPSLNHEHQGNRGQPKLGQMYDHGPYTGYEQSGAPAGRMMAQNGPTQGPPNVNPAMNGMASHYHNNPANSSNPCHGYPGDAGGGGGGGGGVWGQQQQQQQQQSRSAYQQPPTQPGGGPNQIGGYQMSQGNYGGMQGPPTPNAARMNQHYAPQSMAPPPAQDPSHYLGHVGMGGAQMRHPQPQPQPQGYPNMGHTPRYPHSPSRQPQHTHQHQQGMGGFGGSQYPGYQAQYGAIGPGMGQSANTNISTNTSQAMAPGQLGQRFNQGSGPAAGQQGQRYPPAPPHQPQPLQTHSTPMQQQAGQQGQPMHPLNHTQHPQNVPQSQNQPQSHLAPPAQGSYPSPSSMSPMRVLGTPTPPPQQGRPPSAGLAGPPEVAGYTALQSPPNAMPHPQRTPQTPLSTPHPQHQQPHNMPSNAGQMYPGIGPQRGPQMGPNRPQLQQQQGKWKNVCFNVTALMKILFGFNSCEFFFLPHCHSLVSVAKSGENNQSATTGGGASGPNERLYWPAASALTARLRRLITAYQRSNRREQLRQEALNRPDGRRRRRRERLLCQRWTRREEADFYRVVSTFGVVFDTQRQKFDWTQFRAFARLDKKTDESLEKYYYSFIAMCKRVCRMQVKTETDPTLIIDPITEERASRTLYRIELLRRIREQVLPHPLLSERLKLCQPSSDLPEWWECGRHDRDLLLGASKHGVSRTDYHILNDPTLDFLEAHQRSTSHGEEEKTSKPADEEDKYSTEEEKKSSSIVDSPRDEKETTAETSEQPESSPTAQPDHKTVGEEDGEEKENPESPKSPKSADTEKSPEEEEEDRMDEDDKSEKSSQAEASAASEQKNFDEESIASLSTSARDETRDGFCPDDLPETSALQALQDRTYAFSFWPKDRVMINRMDNICEAVLKGKWPVNRRHIFDFPSNLLPGHSSAVTAAAVATATDSPLQRRSLAELTLAGIHTPYSGSEDKTLSPQIPVSEGALSLTVPRRRRRRRKIEIEAERAAKRRNLMEMVAQLRESHAAAESQSQAIDLTKASPSLAGFPSALVTSPSLKAQMELLQQAPPSGHRANGSLEADLPIMRRRRGRRKNVEGLELLFMSNKRAGGVRRDDADGTKASAAEAAQDAARAHRSLTVPEQSPSARSLASGSLEEEEAAVSNKELGEWLRQHPTYTMDMAGLTPKSEELLLSQFSKPKQKRHRCRNPNKIDINTLTGDERVPVVNRRNGRKMGGAMAPPMKELPRWLIENPEFSIAPDWTDIVKQSGFLPEAMFDRLLTGPVVREEGVRRRGRRPKSEIAKAAAEQQAAIRGINPLLLNSLFGGMDLSSLQSLQSLQLAAGLMAFPAPTDPKQAAASAAAASMLPLMLPGMGGLPNMAAALPNMFSLGGLFGGNLATAAASDEALTTKRKRKRQGEEKEGEGAPQIPAIDSSAEASINGDAAALLAAAGMSANSLAFNPFLLSTMAPGLLYPSMFLPPGLGGLSLPGFPTASTLAELQSAMAGALGGNAVSTNPLRDEEEKGMKAPGEEDEDEDEEDGGGESDLAEEKDEGAEEETRGEADDSLLEDGGMGGEEEEATASPQKDKSD